MGTLEPVSLVPLMLTTTATTTALAQAQTHYDRSHFLQAYQSLLQVKPFKDWTATTQEQIFSGRLAYYLGAPRLGLARHLKAGRRCKFSQPDAAFYYAQSLQSLKGPLHTWEWMTQWAMPKTITPQQKANWLALGATTLGELRDFDRAEAFLQQAQALDPQNPWLYTQQSHLLEAQDQYEAALDVAHKSLALNPQFSSGLSQVASLLVLLEKPTEAIALLQTAAHLESSDLVQQLASLQQDQGDYKAAQQNLQKALTLMPLIEPQVQRNLYSRTADLAYDLGDHAQTIHLAQQITHSPFHETVVQRLSQPDLKGDRIIRPVSFIRQHEMTCAPATLAMVSRYWNQAVDHLAIAEEICYDGTSSANQRRWAEQNGFVVREFTITWDNVVALIDQGIPIALSTVETTSAHLQAIIGYDSYLQQFLIRDPYLPSLGKTWAPGFLKHYAAFGPRGMALVPKEKAALFETVEKQVDLVDRPLYDTLYKIDLALAAHQRDQAIALYETLVKTVPQHRMTHYAQRAIALYDGDITRIAEAGDRLLALFPDQGTFLRDKYATLTEFAPKEERLAFLKEVCKGSNSHPYFWQAYATELSEDDRQAEKAIAILRTTISHAPSAAENYATLGDLLWNRQEFKQAFNCYRFATCLSQTHPRYARSYFLAARHLNQTDVVLKLLEQRWQRLGHKASEPALTLCWAYGQLDRTPDALKLLKQATEKRPDDGALWLSAASVYADYGQFTTATALLNKAQGKASPNAWLQTAARLAKSQGHHPQAIQHWQQVLADKPLDMEAIHALVHLFAETQGNEVSLEFLKERSDRFPHSYALQQLYASWLDQAKELPQAEQVLRRLVQLNPSNNQAHLLLAQNLYQQQRYPEAFETVEIARSLDPNALGLFSLLGRLYQATGDTAKAMAAYREVIGKSVDSDWAIHQWLSLCTTNAQRQKALTFIHQALLTQVSFGDGLIAYQAVAAETLPAGELVQQLWQLCKSRPDLWQAWSAVIQQLIKLDRPDQALDLAQKAKARFPLIPGAWFDLAQVYRLRQEPDLEARSLLQVLKISPDYSDAIHRLSELYEQTDRTPEAEQLLRQAIARSPLNATNYGYLAELLANQTQYGAAIEQLEEALDLELNYPWAWAKLQEWSLLAGQPERALTLARRMTRTHPQLFRAWISLATILTETDDRPECLAAIDQAIQLNPRSVEAYVLKSQLLVAGEQWEEAIAACQPEIFGKALPLALLGQRSEVERLRGNGAEAMRVARMMIDRDQKSEVGWLAIARLHYAADNAAGYLEAAQKLVELDPKDANYWYYLGEAQGSYPDQQGLAEESYGRSLELDPSHARSALTLFSYQLDRKDATAASNTLKAIAPHIPPVSLLYRKIQLAAYHRDLAQAQTVFQDFCALDWDAIVEEQSDGLLWSALGQMETAGWIKPTVKMLKQTVQTSPQVSTHIRMAWIRLAVKVGEFAICEAHLKTLDVKTLPGAHAYSVYLDAMADSRHHKQLVQFIRSNQNHLQSTTQLWASTARALGNMRQYAWVLTWMRGWQNRPDLSPWMLLPLNEARRHTGYYSGYYLKGQTGDRDTLLEASAVALKLGHQDHTSRLHLCWLSYDMAIMGRTQESIDMVMSIGDVSDKPEYLCLKHLIRVLILSRSVMASKQVRLQLMNRHLNAALAAHPQMKNDAPFHNTFSEVLGFCFVQTCDWPLFMRWCKVALFKQYKP